MGPSLGHILAGTSRADTPPIRLTVLLPPMVRTIVEVDLSKSSLSETINAHDRLFMKYAYSSSKLQIHGERNERSLLPLVLDLYHWLLLDNIKQLLHFSYSTYLNYSTYSQCFFLIDQLYDLAFSGRLHRVSRVLLL